MRDDQHRTLNVLNNIRDSKSFSGTGNAEQYLRSFTGVEAFAEFNDCLRLIAGRLKR
jgi:hypothetical protein